MWLVGVGGYSVLAKASANPQNDRKGWGISMVELAQMLTPLVFVPSSSFHCLFVSAFGIGLKMNNPNPSPHFLSALLQPSCCWCEFWFRGGGVPLYFCRLLAHPWLSQEPGRQLAWALGQQPPHLPAAASPNTQLKPPMEPFSDPTEPLVFRRACARF